jgi:hypothetical protein
MPIPRLSTFALNIFDLLSKGIAMPEHARSTDALPRIVGDFLLAVVATKANVGKVQQALRRCRDEANLRALTERIRIGCYS